MQSTYSWDSFFGSTRSIHASGGFFGYTWQLTHWKKRGKYCTHTPKSKGRKGGREGLCLVIRPLFQSVTQFALGWRWMLRVFSFFSTFHSLNVLTCRSFTYGMFHFYTSFVYNGWPRHFFPCLLMPCICLSLAECSTRSGDEGRTTSRSHQGIGWNDYRRSIRCWHGCSQKIQTRIGN